MLCDCFYFTTANPSSSRAGLIEGDAGDSTVGFVQKSGLGLREGPDAGGPQIGDGDKKVAGIIQQFCRLDDRLSRSVVLGASRSSLPGPESDFQAGSMPPEGGHGRDPTG